MRKVYLFVHNEGVDAREDLKKILDAIPEVLDWRYDMISSFYIVSEHSANTLAVKIRDKWQNGGRFIITEIKDNYWGWATDDTWYLIKHKHRKSS